MMNKKRPILWLALALAVLLALPTAAWAEPIISNEVVITPVPEEPIDPEQPVVEPGLALYASLSPDVSAPGGTAVLSVVLANTGETLAHRPDRHLYPACGAGTGGGGGLVL